VSAELADEVSSAGSLCVGRSKSLIVEHAWHMTRMQGVIGN